MKPKWKYTTREWLLMTEAEIVEVYSGHSKEYCDSVLAYCDTLRGLIANCKEGQLIMLNIHGDFPQTKEDHAIVFKGSTAYRILNGSDDFNIVVDIDEYFNLLTKKK